MGAEGDWLARPIVAWDGEGVTDDTGIHRYVLLAGSDGDEITDADGLDAAHVSSWLYAALRHRDAPAPVHVGFGLSYDVNMLLRGDRTITRDRLAAAWRGEWIPWGSCWIRYVPRKCFQLCKSKPTGERDARNSVRIWDVHSYFQMSFLGALKKYGYADDKALALIETGKRDRSKFNIGRLSFMLRYNRAELRALVWLVERLRDDVNDAGLRLKEWWGPGSLAGYEFQRRGMARYFPANLDARVNNAACYAYFGGRVEAPRYGQHDASLWTYDIRSAYPDAIRRLPSLSLGRWIHNGEPSAFTLARVTWDLRTAHVYPFPWRQEDGRIYFPRSGQGWYWWPEIETARAGMEAGYWRGDFEIKETWAWHQDAGLSRTPWDWVANLYERRATLKRAGRGGEKPLKLILNASYGKLAQYRGRTGHRPRWHSIEYAGWITSYTRAKLLRAAFPLLASRSLVMFATDSILTTRRLEANTRDELGGWEEHAWAAGTLVQSGVYWLRDANGEWLEHTRGFDADELNREDVIAGWLAGAHSIPVLSTRFVTMGHAAIADSTFDRWCRWESKPRELALHPDRWGKRFRVIPSQAIGRFWHTTANVPPMMELEGHVLSAPYPLPWLLEEVPAMGAVKAQSDALEAARALDMEADAMQL